MNSQPIKLRMFAACAISAIFMTSCSLSQPYPAKQLYAITVNSPIRSPVTTRDAVLRVSPVLVSKPYSSRVFTYRVGPDRYEQDYYANFVAEPKHLLTMLLINWVSTTGMFNAVVDSTSMVETKYSLNCLVTSLYGDYTDQSTPQGVIAVRFFLIDESIEGGNIIFVKDYLESSNALDGSPDALVDSWGRCVELIFGSATEDIGLVLDSN